MAIINWISGVTKDKCLHFYALGILLVKAETSVKPLLVWLSALLRWMAALFLVNVAMDKDRLESDHLVLSWKNHQYKQMHLGHMW